MELADSKLIEMLLAGPEVRKSNIRRDSGARVGESTHQTARLHRRCQCGQCAPCQENARWERIFSEKFADPEYYALSPVRFGSPLSSF